MLNIKFKVTENTLFKISDYFNLNFETEWLKNPLVRQMIKAVDKSEVIGDRVIDSPVFGTMSPMELSGGVKGLILMIYEPEKEYYGSAFGDNCAPWILEIAKLHDINIAFEHIMEFPNTSNLNIHIINSGKIINTMKELVYEAIKYLN